MKEAFNAAFRNRNKSAIIAELMREAVERKARRQRSREAIDRILERRKHAPAISDSVALKWFFQAADDEDRVEPALSG